MKIQDNNQRIIRDPDQLKEEARTLNTLEMKTLVRKFNSFIEKNKHDQAYSDFKEGVNKGLDIAKYTFEENLEKLSLSGSEEDNAKTIRMMENNFIQLLDGITLSKKPNISEERLDGIQAGFEESKKIYREFVKEYFPQENT